MASAVLSKPMTTEEFLALPDNGTERWLIAGELREKPLTVRNRFHSKAMANTSKFLGNWRDQLPEPRGDVLCGEAGVQLSRNPDSTFGIDVMYVSPEVTARQSDETTLIDGLPLLAVEILSPNDTVEEIHEKVNEFLTAGVALVWVINPYDHTVTIYRPKSVPTLVNESQELIGDPVLPGFRVPVADLFR
jgi:Uma2 family endonuclease